LRSIVCGQLFLLANRFFYFFFDQSPLGHVKSYEAVRSSFDSIKQAIKKERLTPDAVQIHRGGLIT
jgi:hypothetical protein